MYVVRHLGSQGWQENDKTLKIASIVNVMFLRKFKNPISCFQNEGFLFFFISVFFQCLLFFIRTFDYH